MTKSKYSNRKIVTDEMVAATVAWADESLVFDIPILTEYSAFSRKLLGVALSSKISEEVIEVTEDMVERSMDFLAYSPVLNISAIMTDPEFIRELLTVALTAPTAEAPSANVVDLLAAPAAA